MILLQGGGEIDIQYEGPLARAQRGSELLAVQRFYELAIPLSQMNPDVLDNIDDDEVVRLLAQQAGLPTRLLRDPKLVASIRESRLKAKEEMQQMQAAQQFATMGKDLGVDVGAAANARRP